MRQRHVVHTRLLLLVLLLLLVVPACRTTPLDNIWPGRFTLGIGPGEVANYGPLVDVSGPPPHRFYTRTREFIEVLRGVWASTQEEPFSFEGRLFQVEDAHLSLKPVTEPHPPIYLAALGERMKELTGQVAPPSNDRNMSTAQLGSIRRLE